MDEMDAYLYDGPFIDSFPSQRETEQVQEVAATQPQVAPLPIRTNFPPAGSKHLGGSSDGYVYRTTFRGRNLEHTYEMVRAFLSEQGYSDVPLPADADELLLFRLPTRNRQILLFEDNGYVHNPVKILFPLHTRRPCPHALILELYNEQAEHHLLRFHRKISWPPTRDAM